MDMQVRIEGLEEALAAMRAAFPDNYEQQRRLLNQAMAGSAKKSFIPMAKQLARRGDSSGALSESIAARAASRSRSLQRSMTAFVQVTPVRFNRKAIAMYVQHYYTRLGKNPGTKVVTSGIRHGHLVEFGTRHSPAQPFLWPAATAQRGKYIAEFAGFLRKKTEAAVRRRARTKVRRR